MGQLCCKDNQKSVSLKGSAHLHHNLLREQERDFREVYDVVALIGEGSISQIYKIRKKESAIGGSSRLSDSSIVTHTSETTKPGYTIFALKEIDTTFLKEGCGEVLRNEIELLKDLDHPNIIKAYETFHFKNKLSIVMEICTGGDLYTRYPYTEKQAARIIEQVLAAVTYLHSMDVIHRDIKFENILFENKAEEAQIKLIDFGLATVYTKRKLTDRVGTAYTMSPEVIQGEYTSKADLWAIGVTTYMLLSGEKPFWGKTQNEIIQAVMKGQYKFDAKVWKNRSQKGKDFISALLQVEPAKRPTAKKAFKHPWLSKKTVLSDRKPDADALNSAQANLVRYADSGDFKKLAMYVIAKKSTTEDILELRKVFEEYDSDKDGTISFSDFKKALTKSSYTDKEIEIMFQKVDVNRNGVIMYTEFLAATLEARGQIEEAQIADAFDQIDSDDSGFISRENLRKILGETTCCSDDYIESLIKEADNDGDGQISYDEFRQYVTWKNTKIIDAILEGEVSDT